MPKDQKVIEALIVELLDKPEAMKLKRNVDELGVMYQLWVDKMDMPRLIGTNGENIKAIRRVVRMIGYRYKVAADLKLEEPK